jgi:hypothetical protein
MMMDAYAELEGESECRRWVRLRQLPADVLADMPNHVRIAFAGAARHDFDVELLCPGVAIPLAERAARRLVVFSDDLSDGAANGPVAFDLATVAADIRACRRVYVMADGADAGIYDIAYTHAVNDLAGGAEVGIIIETRSSAAAWERTVRALRHAPAAFAAAGRG